VTTKQVLVTLDRGETRVAILETGDQYAPDTNGAATKPQKRRRTPRQGVEPGEPDTGARVAELYVERRGSRSIVGNIYKGRVDNVLPGLEAAFIDIGLDKNGFLHVDDIVMPGVDIQRRGKGRGKRISELLTHGQEIIVQVVKDPLKTKGARLSMQLSIAGRYLVYVPQGEGVGISRRLDETERERLRSETEQLALDGGAIVRTAAHGAERADFEREIKYLFKLYEVLQRRAGESPAPALVFQEADLSVRVVRDIFSDHLEKAWVDSEKQYERLTSFFARTAPELVERVELYKDTTPLFERFRVEEVIKSACKRRVDLRSGGYLMIDNAEAMTVIDVNSGSFTGRGKGGRLEETITKINLEAAEEVVRQLRLRDIGGIIVIDFIDMSRSRNRETVLKTLRKSLENDRTKTYVVEISPLGLVEMTRQNVTDGLREILTQTCPTCEGEGVVLSEETIAIDVLRRLRELAHNRPDAEAYLVQVHPRVATILTTGSQTELFELEQQLQKHVHFEGSESLALDHFSVSLAGSREEVEERALPFRQGEEVLVDIQEPHMYNAEDAVAKIDGYIISVLGAVRFIGQKCLVRIESVGRNTATAQVVGEPEADGKPNAESSDSGSEKQPTKRRRRGKRGGAGRRGAKATDNPD
jgi:ribonuclease G